MLFRLWVRTLEFVTLMNKPKTMCNLSFTLTNDKKHLDIITIAFNNLELIQYQNTLLKKFIKDRYTHIIVDNSTNKNICRQIHKYCFDNNIAYVGMPKNWLNTIGPSYSHGTALNYAYKHIISKRKPFAFGQIDHDLFPTRPISIIERLTNQPIYGPLRLRDKWWYLSAIFSFFRFDFVKNKKVDFMPVTPDKVYLDSGGGNWYNIYSQIDRTSINFPNECIESLRDGGDRHGDSLEFFDDKLWLHTINGSCWKKINNQFEKNNQVREYLDQLLS